MNITRDIVIDLLPVYESGDASADTRMLVDEFLKQDAEFARILRAARTTPAAAAKPAPAPLAEAERTAVTRTRKALRRKSWTLALAIFFTLLPLTFSFSGGELTFWMLRDEPRSRLFFLSAAWLWWHYFRQTQAMRKAGW
jgi:anti-sigma factor RsiW